MITLKDLVGRYTLVTVPQSILRLFKRRIEYKHAKDIYLRIHNEKVDLNDRMACLKRYKREVNAFDKMTQLKQKYEQEKDKLKSSFKTNG